MINVTYRLLFFRYYLALGYNNKCFYTKEEYEQIIKER
jgi:hypothetical protein